MSSDFKVKKFLATILCFVYVVASSGATIDFHYCMGKFIGWNVATPSLAKCSNCGMNKEEKKGCCNDKHETIQLKKDQLASTVNNVPNNHFVHIHHPYPSSIKPSFSFCIDVNTNYANSPPLNSVSAYRLNCVFRI